MTYIDVRLEMEVIVGLWLGYWLLESLITEVLAPLANRRAKGSRE